MRFDRKELSRATALVRSVCKIAGHVSLIDDAKQELASRGIIAAVQVHDDATIFGWLMETLSFQGVSDRVAWSFMEEHGCITSAAIEFNLSKQRCPKLESFWHFTDCGYRKTRRTCSEPRRFGKCALPRHDLRNGNLNQAAYSLFLFFRDIGDGDFVGWLDDTLARADTTWSEDRGSELARAVVEPLSHVFGIGDKVLNMSLSQLLLAGDPKRERWQAAGAAMIAVDTLVHNFLHRTGILSRLGATHKYGRACYLEGGCATVLKKLSQRIDASEFNPSFPAKFPRFVQHAIWTYCSEPGLDICNGVRIDDDCPCAKSACKLFKRCDRLTLHTQSALT